ncbi:MAG: pyruvate synthase [Nitrospinaceae bacterium]|nr:pyruvate synthase [Nitrospinaceae bacterium]NIR55359.1 pyruvate synthase [Nitrospinaceae bacterium]NIS85799.1 pyruvate synthase [Nitrospinaceae bacterium]NIT82651.1 pyruvate synthase [Nitrospinaceae bacterium]NIU44853.1 pyruvate synthase [Nitrospinaceae bacterium]
MTAVIDTFEEFPYRKVKDLNPQEEIAPGSPLCAGCGGLEGMRLALKALGEDTLICNAAGCFTLISVYPFTPLKGSWLYTTMGGSVPAAQGVRDALDIRKQKYGLSGKRDLQVMVVAGDGSSYDMGLGPSSAAIHRGLDFIYFCYDNEAYGNTGFQMSGASPLGSYTQTSPSTLEHPAGAERSKKDLFSIWTAHRPTYVATVSPREPIDLSNKFKKAKGMKGPRLFLCLSPCPTGWGFDPKETHLIAKLAVDTGIFPIKEFIDGQVIHTKRPRKRVPVEKYLERQKRFRHLFEPERRDDIIAQIQKNVDGYWEPYDD